MARTVTIELDVAGIDADDVAAWRELVARVLENEGTEPDAVIGVLLTGDSRMTEFNRDFRGIEGPTDVLSFAGGEDDFPVAVGEPVELGDIVISIDAARRQADEHEWSLQQEVGHLLIHATLHLCGWDHEQGPEAERSMRLREEHYLGPLDGVHGEPG